MVSWGRKRETTLCNYHTLRTGSSRENKNKNPEAQAPYRESCYINTSIQRAVYVQDIGVSQETFISFQALNCLCILMTSKWVASGPRPTPFLYLALQSQSPGVQILPAWCSSHRNCCCPWSWFAAFLGGKPHHQSYLCRMQLKPGKKEMRKEKPQWPQLHRVQSPKDSHLS